MLTAFLMGLLAIVGVITVAVVVVISGRWLINYVKNKLKNREKHKVAFADVREIVDDYIRNKVNNSEEISMEDLEKMCEETPYVAAVIDEEGEISEYEGFKSSKCSEKLKDTMKQEKGMIIVGD